MSKETDARIVIDRLLREAGWDIENPAMISTEEAAADGRADYLLKNSRTQPLRKARKFGAQYHNDFPDLLAKWPTRAVEAGRAWRVPAKKIIENGYNLSLASLGLVEPEKTDHAEPEDILAGVAEKERRILEIVEEMRGLLANSFAAEGPTV